MVPQNHEKQEHPSEKRVSVIAALTLIVNVFRLLLDLIRGHHL